MKSERKYIINEITQFTKNRLIIRNGGYYPFRLVIIFCLSLLLIAMSSYLFTIDNDLWRVALYPLGFILFFGLSIVRYTSMFGEKISINHKRVLIQSYRGLGNKVIFKKADIKSVICTQEGANYRFTIWNLKNKKIEFHFKNTRKGNPLNYIVDFLKLQQLHQTRIKNKITTRLWTRNPQNLRKPREIQNIGEELYDYRSEYFDITSNKNQLTVRSLDQKNNIILNKDKRTLKYINEKKQPRTINTKNVKSIQYHLKESNPGQNDNRITVIITATTIDNQEIPLLREVIIEQDPSNLEILDIELDFKNLVAIIDMTIKASIDVELDALDLDSKPNEQLDTLGKLDLKPLPEKLNSEDELNT